MKKLLALLLFVSVSANAQFTDDFNRSELLDASADWTDNGAGGDALTLDGAVAETEGTESLRIIYTGPAQASADFYVEADILFAPDLTTNNEGLIIHAVDNANYIYFRRNNTSTCLAGIRLTASDNTWFSDSSALCDNASRFRIEAEGSTIRFYIDDTLYHTEESVTDLDSSVLGGLVSTGAGGTDAVDLWDNFEMDVLAAPDFTSDPALDDCTDTACTFDYTANAAGDTIYGMLTDTAASAPTCDAIEATTGTHGDNSDTTTGSADTLILTSADTPEFPLYDAHFCIEDSDGTDSAVVTVSDNALDAPTGFQFVAITSVGSGSLCEDFNTSTAPDIASGDYLLSPDAVSPGGGVDDTLTIGADCQFSYDADNTGVQSVPDVAVYDASVGAYHADDIDAWFNNTTPVCAEGVYDPLVLDVGEAMSTIDFDTTCTDDDAHTLTYSITSGSLPSGTSLDDSEWSGTPNAEVEAGIAITVTATDPAGATDTFDMNVYPIDTITLADYTEGTDDEAVTQHLTDFPWQSDELALVAAFVCSDEAANEVVSQVPSGSTEVTAFQSVNISVSTGSECTETSPNAAIATVFISAAVPAGSAFISGTAYAPSGRYVTTCNLPAVTYARGIAHRNDGAMCIDTTETVDVDLAGWGLTDDGIVVADTCLASFYANGIPRGSDGSVCMTDVN